MTASSHMDMPGTPTATTPRHDFDTSKFRARRARERAERAAEAARLHAVVLEAVPTIVARHGASAA